MDLQVNGYGLLAPILMYVKKANPKIVIDAESWEYCRKHIADDTYILDVTINDMKDLIDYCKVIGVIVNVSDNLLNHPLCKVKLVTDPDSPLLHNHQLEPTTNYQYSD